LPCLILLCAWHAASRRAPARCLRHISDRTDGRSRGHTSSEPEPQQSHTGTLALRIEAETASRRESHTLEVGLYTQHTLPCSQAGG